MNKHGLYSQLGFEFQKLVFVYNVLGMGSSNQIIYEGCDDVEISSTYFPLFKLYDDSNPNKLIQVKSGNVDVATLKKVLMNWLIVLDKNKEYRLFLENKISFDYNDKSFIDKFVEEILTTTKRKNAIIRQVKDLYINDADKLKEDTLWIINNFKIDHYGLMDIKARSYELFKKDFSRANDNEIILQEQFDDFLRIIRSEIADKILEKIQLTLTRRELYNIVEDVRNRINEDKYDISYSEFKPTSEKKAELLLSKNGESIKQLKLVTHEKSRIIDYLVEQIFYEDFKSHFETIEKIKEIKDLEYLAHSNYEDVLFELEDESYTPKKLFIKTTSKELKSPLFLPQSSNISFYSRGCYIHLTDDTVDENLKIRWGELNED